MKTIVIKTQAEIDALPDSFSEYTQINVESTQRIIVRKARGNSSVVAWNHSSVEAWGNSSVEAWNHSSVVARGCSTVHAQSDFVSVALFMCAVCFAHANAKIKKQSKTCTVIVPVSPKGTEGWLENNAIKATKTVIVFKRVSKDFLTQEGTHNETKWEIGSTLEHPAWNPTISECGAGKYHFCCRPSFCDEFRT
ncbi:MAG: hypothetical protein ACRD43_14500, partial [Pyrinomonadaceae bacterium]